MTASTRRNVVLGIAIAALAGIAALGAWLLRSSDSTRPVRVEPIAASHAAEPAPPSPVSASQAPLAPSNTRREGAAPIATPPESAAPPSGPASTQLDRQLAGLRVHLVDDRGDTPNATYLVHPLQRDGAPGPRKSWREGVSDSNGRVELADLAPGRWIAVFAPTYRAPQRFQVELAPGWNDLGELRFPALGDVSDLRVRLGGPGWHGGAGGVLHVRSTWGDDVDRWNRIGQGPWMRELTAEESRFTFQGLPHGRYELTFFRSDVSAAARMFTVDVPGEELVIELAASEPSAPLQIALEDERGQPIDGGTIWLWQGDGARAACISQTGPAGLVLPRGAPREGTLIALARGFTAVSIAAERLPASAPSITIPMKAGASLVLLARDEQRWLDVPGVGMELEIGRTHAPPLPGLDVIADGRALGHSDERGIAIVELPRRAAAIELTSATHVVLEAANLDGITLQNELAPVEARCVRRR